MPKHPHLIEALRTHAHDDMGDVDAEHVHIASIAADEIEYLRSLLRLADAIVVWEDHATLGRGFQEEIEFAL